MGAKKKKAVTKKRGRPSAYRKEHAEQAFKLCLLGAKDEELADFFGVRVSTIKNWKQSKPEFLAALKEGKDEADANVSKSLYRRAIGYEHDAVKIVADAKTGSEHIVHYTERYPPDTTACIFWLKNRQRAKWRDVSRQEHSGLDGGPIRHEFSEMTDDELRRILEDD